MLKQYSQDILALASLIVLAMLLWIAAYQMPLNEHIFVGGNPHTHKREYDAPFLHGFNASEPENPKDYRWWNLSPGYAYRWSSRNATIHLPGTGGERWVFTLLAISGRPAGEPALSKWHTSQDESSPPLSIAIDAAPRTYHILVDATTSGDIAVSMETHPYVSPNDPRDLGFALRGIRIAPTKQAFQMPAVGSIAWLSLSLLVIYGLSRWLMGQTNFPTKDSLPRIQTREDPLSTPIPDTLQRAQRVQSHEDQLLLGNVPYLSNRAIAIGATLAYIVGVAYLLALHRFTITLFAPRLAIVLLASAGLAIVIKVIAYGAQHAVPSMYGHTQANPEQGEATVRTTRNTTASYGDTPANPEHGRTTVRTHSNSVLGLDMNPIILLVVLGFAIRLGGMLHPYAIFSDHRLNANNLLEVGTGTIYFTEGLPHEAGGGQAPYPPGSYLLSAPAQLFVSATMEHRVLVVQSSIALLDSLVILLLWLLLRQAGMGQRESLMGAALYLVPAPMMASFSIGEYANIGGQFLALPAIVSLAYCDNGIMDRGKYSGRGITRYAPLLVAFCIGMLGHMGVTISLVLVLGAWWLLKAIKVMQCWLRNRAMLPSHLNALNVVTLSGIGAGLFATLFYYTAPPFRAIFAQRLSGQTEIEVATPPAGETLARMFSGLFAPHSKLLPLLLVVGITGAALVLTRTRWQQQGSANLQGVLVAWWVGVILSFGLLIFANQGVRWQHFLYPALCLGAALVAHAYSQRGGMGRLVVWVCVLAPVCHGVVVWVRQIGEYLH